MTTETMQALLLSLQSNTATVQTLPIPSLAPNELLIKVSAIALNPVDALYVAKPIASTDRVVGSDFAGTVVQAPSSSQTPPSSRLQPGARVAGFLQGACSVNPRPGAFAEYVTCPEDLVWRIQDDMAMEQAAGVSLCALTAAQAVFYRLGLLAPFDWRASASSSREVWKEGAPAANTSGAETQYFFLYGASTSVGLYAAQLVRHSARTSGRTIKLIGASSRARFDMLKAEPYAYDALVDYRDSDWPAQVLQHTGGQGVTWAYDCISEGSTVRDVCRTLRKEGGKVAVVRSKEYGAWDPSGVPESIEPIYGAVWEGLGEEVEYNGKIIAASEDARRFAVAFYEWLSSVGSGDDGGLVANPIRLMPGGLEQVAPDGFALLGAGGLGGRIRSRVEEWTRPISAEKLVYRI